ncbi:uncharacterized protein LOC126382175 [Pectinophora gossypiella]|uniref:uncharacterized protein LOC126382175 n=1 Tax=Pectinophora gossypiella TaxID=13191 RepID=UPI00214ECC29|nr:uncharacterized protein LOC126382175 [Pectinophora gossypiella]
MASERHATRVFICICLSFSLPVVNEGAKVYEDGFSNDDSGMRLTREYHLRQGAIRGLIVKPSRDYDLQAVEMFLGIPYAAPPMGSLRFMPPVSAPPWSGVKKATRFAPVCPQAIPPVKKGNPPSLGRQHYMAKLKPFLTHESEDCLYLNIYVPYREQKSKKFPVLVFVHGDSFEWSSGNPYDGRILASYGNIMVITVNFRLGILGFMKPSLTEHVYGNNGLLDQLAALQWIKDNIEDLNGDPHSVTLMGHGTGAACVNFLMLSPISNGLFHRAILMSGSALSNWAMTKDPTQYTLQVAQSLGCNPTSKNLMTCLQNKPLSELKKVQILAREFETPLGPVVAGSFIPNEPAKTMESFPNLLSKYQILSGVTELESYHNFGVIELDHGVLENQRDEFITKYVKLVYGGAEDVALREILKQYAPSKLDPQRWSVEANRDVILNLFSDANTLSPMIKFANYQSKANRQSYFYVFGHNSENTDYAPLNKSVHGEELPYVLGIPLGGANTHFHVHYTQKEKLLSEVMMRLWTNFVKMGTPNTQSVNEYYSLDKKQWNQYNVEWPEYNVGHQSYLKLDIPPYISSLYRSNYTNFWIEYLPNKMRRYVVDPLFEYTPIPTTQRPKPSHKPTDTIRKLWPPKVANPPPRFRSSYFGRVIPNPPPVYRPDTDKIYREIQAIKTPSRPLPPGLMEKPVHSQTTVRPKPVANMPMKTSGATITLIISLGILFLAVNVGICAILYFKKRKLRLRERTFEGTHHSRAEIGEVDVIGQKSAKDEKSALQTFKNSCSVIKSISINKMRNNSKKGKKNMEHCKTPKSDDSGGFRERFQLRRHLSTSTLDAHTKVRDWIANEVMHRCSPHILRKSNSDLNTDKQISVTKPFTRSEELLSDPKKSKKDPLKIDDNIKSKTLQSKTSNKTKTSEKTTSTSALGSHSSIASNKLSISTKHTQKSNDSLKSKGTESVKSKKVSVAIDATPAARTNSILKQEPIELSRSFDCNEPKHSNEDKMRRSKTEIDCDIIEIKPEKPEEKTYTNVVTLSLGRDKPLKITHKHSSSDPVTDINYDKLKEKLECATQIVDILPPVTFRNEVNVTSRDESLQTQPLSAAEALLTIQRRNFPKVLPDLPKAQKRLSLQPTALQTFRSIGSVESQSERSKVPPQPPPRTTTLDRRLAYKNTKPLSSFDTSNVKKIPETDIFPKNYENINTLSPYPETNRSFNKSFERSPSFDKPEPTIIRGSKERDYPKVIIASSDIPSTPEPTIVIKPSSSQTEIPSNAPRVRLPDDFHSGSITSFSSFCSEDDDDDEELEDDLLDEFAEDQLIKELVGGVESPTNMEDVLDSKGPATMFEKRLEIIPVKINPGHIAPKRKEDYICISDLQLPDVSDLEKTAQIKPNFGLNKLQHRSESIHRPPEKAVKLRQKKTMKPAILNKSMKSRRSSDKSSDSSKLEHSNSNSSNDTEASTGTVKKVEVKKD